MLVKLLLAGLIVGNISAENALKVLIIGSGAREHALAWKVAQSPRVAKVFVAPGNAGTALEKKIENVDISATDIHNLALFAQQHAIDLTIVGPEISLEAGIVDVFAQRGLHCFGPTKQAARLETSKKYAKEFMVRHGIATAQYAQFTNFNAACAYIEHQSFPLVIKADGLAAGKGVVIANTKQEAIDAASQMLENNEFGAAGHCIIIEEFLAGQEATYIVMTDGKHIISLPTAQDHKKRDNGDMGPNTGGMGAYSPASVITPELEQHILCTIIAPTIAGLAQEGIPYCGFLYAGLMILPNGDVKVLEFNCRLGDPEAQPILMRLQSDLVQLCLSALNTELDTITVCSDERVALCVVLASGGYPGAYKTGLPIHGLMRTTASEVKIFHGGTVVHNNQIVTAGGRVLCVTALADTLCAAQEKAYAASANISWPHMFYRTDIGHRAIKEK